MREYFSRRKSNCTFEMSENLLKDINFTIQRSGIAYSDCAYGSQLNNGVCELCGKGKYRNEASSSDQCSQCPKSEYTPNKGSKSCFPCENGYVDKTGQTCTPCAPGEVVDGDKCTSCAAGHYANKTNCTQCEPFKYSSSGFTECYSCKDGHEVTENQIGCRACHPGMYNNQSKTSKCKRCEGQKYTTDLYGQIECNVPIEIEKYCPEITFSASAVGDLTFSSVKAGQKSIDRCPNNAEGSAVRPCNVDGQWGDPDINACDSMKTGSIKNINVESEASMDALNTETEDTNEVAPKDIEEIVSKMTRTEVNNVFNSSTGASIQGLAKKSMKIISNIMAASKSSPTDQRIKNDIVHSFEHIAVLSLEHMKEGDINVLISTEATDVILVRNADTATETIGDSNIKINIDNKSNIQNLAALIYKDNSAFKPPPNPKRGTTSIVGKVVGLKHTKRVGDSKNNSISFKMKFDFPDLSNPEKKPRQMALKQCKYYDTESDTWSTKGCTTTEAPDGSVECECDHMTSFAVILSVQESKVPMWLSNLVLGINITFCLLTLLCTLPFRTFRVRKMTIIQSHSILSLLLLCVTWFVMQDLKLSENKPAYESMECKAVAFVAHYFLMATFSWIFCCSLTLKSQIVDALKSFGKKNKNLVKKCVLFGYGFPLLIPSLALLMDSLMKKYSPEGQELHYIRELECWYEDIWVYSFILFPIYIFFIINFVCFINIMRVVSNARRSSDGSSDRRVVKAGFALAFTQGLPWIMHPGALTDGAAEVFQYLFLITFGFQGIGLFVFNVLFQEEVLKNLCGLLNVKPPLIFLSVVPSKQRRTPNSQTGETSLGTARNSTGNNDKCYSNNLATYYEDESVCMEDSEGEGSTGTSRSRVEHINFRSTLNSVATVAVGEKSLYQDSSHYNELHESSLVAEHRADDTYSHLNVMKTRELAGSSAELGPPLVSPRVVTFVAGTRAYGFSDGQRSPIPGETEALDHQGPPLM